MFLLRDELTNEQMYTNDTWLWLMCKQRLTRVKQF